MRHGVLLWGLLLVALPAAHAADQTVRGTSLVVRDGGTPAKRKIVVKARETATDDILVGDPTVSGAEVTITVDGASSSNQVFLLPQLVHGDHGQDTRELAPLSISVSHAAQSSGNAVFVPIRLQTA